MLAWLIRGSLNRPRLLAFAGLWLLVLAAFDVGATRLELLPQLASAQATVITAVAGLDAGQVEQLVTQPLEAELVGAPGVAQVHSESVQGLSTLTVRFEAKANPVLVRQGLVERIATARANLPAGAGSPQIAPMGDGRGDVMKIGFTSARLNALDLRDLVQWTVRPRLLAVAGVSRVAVYGGAVRRIEVRARPGDLSDSDLGFLDILKATERATSVAGAGFIDTPGQRVLIEPHGQALTAKEIEAGQIQVTGSAPVRIGDVSDVVEAAAPAFGDALIDGKPGVVASIGQEYGANTLQTTHNIERALAVLQPALTAQGVEVRADLDRPAGFIADSLRGVAVDLAIGVGLILVTLVLFMRDLRAVLISLVSIPLALMAALVAIDALGWTLNVMTLGGLAVALGVVIDEAVIDVENILARLRDAQAQHGSRAEAVLAASLEVRGPVVYATLAMVIALAPLLALPGPEGALLRPFAATIVFASLAALVVAATVTPALALLFLRHVGPDTEPGALYRLKTAHGAGLGRLAGGRLVLPIGAALLAVLIGVLALSFRSEFLPAFHEGHLTATITAPPSTSLDVMRDYGARIARDLRGVPGVQAVSQQIGRDETGDDSWGLEHSRFDVALQPGLSGKRQDDVAAEIGRLLTRYPGLHPIVETRFQGAQPDAGGGFSVSVFGPDRTAIDEATGQIAQTLAALPGAGDVRADNLAKAPTVRIDLDFPRLALFGLSSSDVLDTVQAAFEGEPVARIFKGARVVEVAVSAQANLRRDPETVGDLLLRSSSGVSVPLKRVANVYLSAGPAVIAHDDGLMREQVLATPAVRDADRFGRAAREAIARAVHLPTGVYVEYPGAATTRADTRRALQIGYGMAITAILALLAVAFDGVTVGLIVVATLLSLMGGAVAVWLMGGVLSVGTFAGFVALAGVAVRSAILLIDRVEGLVVAHQAPWSLDTVLRASGERLTPVLMTSLLMALAMLPFVYRAGDGGREVLGPMAIVVLGGLVTSALASLVVLPLLVHWFWRPQFGRRSRRRPFPLSGT